MRQKSQDHHSGCDPPCPAASPLTRRTKPCYFENECENISDKKACLVRHNKAPPEANKKPRAVGIARGSGRESTSDGIATQEFDEGLVPILILFVVFFPVLVVIFVVVPILLVLFVFFFFLVVPFDLFPVVF